MSTVQLQDTGPISAVRIDAVADAAGRFAPVPLPRVEGFWLSVRTEPSGVCAPFDVRVLAAGGYDAIEGCGADRPGDAPAHRLIRYAGVNVHPTIHAGDVLTLVIDGTAPPGARVTVTLRYGRDVALEDLLLSGDF